MTDQNPTQPTPNPAFEQSSARQKTPLAQFLEHQASAAQEAMQAFDALIPPEFRTHSRAARREFLTSFKVLLDAAMATVETELHRTRQSMNTTDSTGSDDSGPSTTGPTKVKVEVT